VCQRSASPSSKEDLSPGGSLASWLVSSTLKKTCPLGWLASWMLKQADWIVDLGPEAGAGGGLVVGQGPPAAIAKLDTPTGRALRG
jgi:hypothetical protein